MGSVPARPNYLRRALPAMPRKYRVIEQLGEGGTARVFLAVTHGVGDFQKLVVLKVPLPQIVAQPFARNMFLAEARPSAKLNHPNVVEVYEVIEQDCVPVIVMQYLDGQSLADLRKSAGAELDVVTHLHILEATLAGLQCAHTLRDYDGTPLEVVHRDVSPHNVMVTYDGQVKVLDFGIAKSTAAGDATEIGTIKGKLTYMAPEQVQCGQVDHRADLFCVGIMLWEAMTGERYWSNVSESEVLGCLCSGRLPHLIPEPTISPAMAAILARALAPDPNLRYASAEEFRIDLERYRQGFGETQSNERCLVELMSRYFLKERRERALRIEVRMGSGSDLPPDSDLRVSVPTGLALSDADSKTVRAIPLPVARKKTKTHNVWALSSLGALAVGLGSAYALNRVGIGSVVARAATAQVVADSLSAKVSEGLPADVVIESQFMPIDAGPRRCTTVPKAHGIKPTIDDFNKIDEVIDSYDGRVGKWYAFHDGSNLPPTIELDHIGFSLAMHVVGGPYAVWGGGVGAALNQDCAYDASIYKGIRVVARGRSHLWLKVLTDENVIPPLGICPVEDERCHDVYQKRLELAPDRWQVYNVAWAELKQRGFARSFPFNSARINHVQFEWREGDVIDAWVDHLGFY